MYAATVFTAYFALGAALIVGIGAALELAEDALASDFAYTLQGILGALLLGVAILWPERWTWRRPLTPPSMRTGALIFLGVSISVVELPTALPFLAAIGAMTAAELPAASWVPLLAGYTAVMISPLLLVIAASQMSATQGRLEVWRERRHRPRKSTWWLWVAGIAGWYLLVDAVAHFGLFGLDRVVPR